MLQDLLNASGLTLESLKGVVVGVGPGSFTGIKIGLSFAYGMKRASPQLEMSGISALRALIGMGHPDRISLLPATQTAGYFAKVEKGERILGIARQCEGKDPEGFHKWELVQTLKDSKGETYQNLAWDGDVRIIGKWPAAEEYLTRQSKTFERTDVETIAESLLRGMLADFASTRNESLQLGLPQPLYLRRSAPEEKLMAVPT
jgi:tRNA A37 threonylcarbamoyladenosine modification protein TsaB